MAFYTDYETVVPFNTSIGYTLAVVTNVITNQLIAHANCTRTRTATETANSSNTNYAEVCYNGLYIRFYNNNTYTAVVTCGISTTSGGAVVQSYNYNVLYDAGIAVTVRLRFYNVKTGILVHIANTAFTPMLWACACKKINDEITTHTAITPAGAGAGATVFVRNPNTAVVTTLYTGYTGYTDTTATLQVLTQAFITSENGSTKINYFITDAYYSPAYLISGDVVQIGNRYFNITSAAHLAIELNV